MPDTFIEEAIASVKNKIKDVVLADSQEVLPDYNGTVTWKSSMPEVVIAEDGPVSYTHLDVYKRQQLNHY